MADSFIPGGDFVPGSDFVPGITDVLGIDPSQGSVGQTGTADTTTTPTDTTGSPYGSGTTTDTTGGPNMGQINTTGQVEPSGGGYDPYQGSVGQTGTAETTTTPTDTTGSPYGSGTTTNTTGGPTDIGAPSTGTPTEPGGGGWTPPTGVDQISVTARQLANTAGNSAAQSFLNSMLGNTANTIGHILTGATGTTGKVANTTGVGAQSQTPNNTSSNRINLTPGLTQATSIPASELGGVFSAIPSIMGSAPVSFGAYAEGHRVEEDHQSSENHIPQFYSEGGLKHRYVQGDGDGTSDSVPAMLANGEFVIPADVVSSLGNGSNDSGSKVLDEFLKTIREHKAKHDVNQLPPDSKGPLTYLEISKTKVEK